MKKMEENRFHWAAPEALEFYNENGYVIVSDVLTDDEREQIKPSWDKLIQESAKIADLSPKDFEERFPQNRDLWSKSNYFHQLLFRSSQGKIASHFLQTDGSRLFHDHAIIKPSRNSSTIPWHQDSTYWPLDRVGNSLWTPTSDVTINGGCLKVLRGSHRDGADAPQDFLRPDNVNRDADPRLIYLPVKKGETVVLNGLTWHSSEPNSSKQDRLAYLTLWVPSSARFTPKHASWHPTTARITVKPGEKLDGDWFPLFGDIGADNEGELCSFEPPREDKGPTMFKALETIRMQLNFLINEEDISIKELLSMKYRQMILDETNKLNINPKTISKVLEDLALQDRVREQVIARDVYLVTIQQWWHIIGNRIMEKLSHETV